MNEELFNRYLNGDLNKAEKEAFENQLKTDDSFRNAFNEHKAWFNMLNKSLKRRELKNQLNDIHGKMSKKTPIRILPSKKVRRLRTFGSIAAAATVAALVTISILNFTAYPLFDKGDQYIELRNEIDEVTSAQASLEKMVAESSKKKPQVFTGSCFAISSNGYLITNYHVIRGVDSVRILNYQDSIVTYRTRIVYRDVVHDLAVLKIEDDNFESFGRLPYGIHNNETDLGSYAFTLGYSKKDIVFGEGSISSLNGYRGDTMAYQVSVPVNPGNSGGPLFDNRGYLIGIISGKNVQKEGAGYAIKSTYILSVMEDLKELNPEDPPVLNNRSRISTKKRTNQIKKIQDYIYKVQVFKS